MQKITPCLWFDGRAEEARDFYLSIFPSGRALSETRYGAAGPGKAGSVMVTTFELEGHTFMALNGGPQYAFTPAVSFSVECETQAEIDHYWDKLSAGGREIRCGWVSDMFGLSWQIVPRRLAILMSDPDKEKARRVSEAMLRMIKLDLAELERAYAGG